jgi:hypothetical protein
VSAIFSKFSMKKLAMTGDSGEATQKNVFIELASKTEA